MKKLFIKNYVYRELEKNFRNWLQIIGYCKTSVYNMPNSLREFFYYLEQHQVNLIEQIQAEDIKNYYKYLSQRPNKRKEGALSSNSLKHAIYSVRLFFNYQQQVGNIQKNPMSSLFFPSPESKQREILSLSEIKQLYEASETFRDKAMLGLFYGCGLRRTEAEKLNIKDINFKSEILYVREGKGRSSRAIPMSNQVVKDFKAYYYQERETYHLRKGIPPSIDDQQAFMLNNFGTRMKSVTYYQRLKELLKLTKNPEILSKNISLHNLRHSIATHLLEKGLSIEKVRDFLGHKCLETTQIYARINDEVNQ